MNKKIFLATLNPPNQKQTPLSGGDIRYKELSEHSCCDEINKHALYLKSSGTQKFWILLNMNIKSITIGKGTIVAFEHSTVPAILLGRVRNKIVTLVRKDQYRFDLDKNSKLINLKNRLVEFVSLAFSKKIIFQTKVDLESFRKRTFGFNLLTKLEIVHNNANTERAQNILIAFEKKKLKNKKRNMLTIGFIGDIKNRRKNFKELYDVYMQLRETKDNINLIIIGCSEQPRWTTSLGYISNCNNYADALAQLDVIVIPTKDEGMTNVITEALLLKLPFLASSIEPNLEILGEQSAVLTYKDQFELKHRILNLDQNLDKMEKSIEILRNRFHFNWTEEIVHKILN